MAGETAPVAALPPQEWPHADRALVRYTPCRKTLCQLSALSGHEFWWAKLVNLSVSGIGILLDNPIEVGGFAFVEVTSASGMFSRLLLTRVIHVSPAAAGGYLLGGEFVTELPPDELRLLLQ